MKSILMGFGLGFHAIGCGEAETTTEDGGVTITETKEVSMLCGACGHAAEDGHECETDCEVCEECSLHKGSELCCKDLGEASGKNLCKACGHVAEEGHECETDCEICDECGLHKGAPLCCKLDADQDDGQGSDEAGSEG